MLYQLSYLGICRARTAPDGWLIGSRVALVQPQKSASSDLARAVQLRRKAGCGSLVFMSASMVSPAIAFEPTSTSSLAPAGR